MLAIFIAYPLLALAPAVLFLLLWLWTRSRAAAIPAILWTGYALYEYGMKIRLLCSGECNIRVDLLLIYPVLAIVSAGCLVWAIRSRFRGPAGGLNT